MYLLYKGFYEKIRNFYFKKILNKCNISKSMDILDYGCGPGDFLINAKELGFQAQGIDSSLRSVKIARSRGLEIIHGDIDSIVFEKKTYDVIILQSVIEHINNPEKLLIKLKDKLKNNGVFIISAPTPGPHFYDDPTHIRPYTAKSLKIIGEILQMKIVLVNYVFSFLLNINLSNSIIYKILNIFPMPLGSNLIAIFRKIEK